MIAIVFLIGCSQKNEGKEVKNSKILENEIKETKLVEKSEDNSNKLAIKDVLQRYLGETNGEKILEIEIEQKEKGKKVNIVLDTDIFQYPVFDIEATAKVGGNIMFLTKIFDPTVNDIDISVYDIKKKKELIGLRCIDREVRDFVEIASADYLDQNIDIKKLFDEIRTHDNIWMVSVGEMENSNDFQLYSKWEEENYNIEYVSEANFLSVEEVLKYYLKAIEEENKDIIVELTYMNTEKELNKDELVKEIFQEDNFKNMKECARKFYEKKKITFKSYTDDSVWVYGSDVIECPSINLRKNSKGKWRIEYDSMTVFEVLEMP